MTSSNPVATPLRQRVMKGGVWTFAGQLANNVLRLISNLILTRLLAPEAFGLVALVSAVNFWLIMMSDIGLNTTMLRTKSPTDQAFFSTIWWTQFTRNAIIAVLLVLIGLALGPLREAGVLKPNTVYSDPRLPVFVYGVALTMLIQGMRAMRSPLYQRDLNMGPVIRLELLGQILGIATMISLALLGVGAYSLIGGMLMTSTSYMVTSYLLLDGPRVTLLFDKKHFKEIFNYGKWIIISSTAGALIARGDQVLFGWFLDSTKYSLYAIATIWVTSAALLAHGIYSKIMMPVFSEIHRERPQDMARVYGKSRFGIEAAALALFLGAQIFADFGIWLLYEPQYADVATYIKLLSVSFLLLPNRLLQFVILSSGDSRRFMLATIIPGLAMVLGTPWVYTHFGVAPAIVFAATVNLYAMPYNWHAAKKYMAINYPRELAQMAVAIIAIFAVILFGQ